MRQSISKKSYIVYTLLMLCSLSIVSTTNKTFALSYQTDVGINFTFNPTLSVSISSDLVIPNLTPGTTDTSNEILVNVSTNNAYGYNLYATVGNSVHNNTNLTHSSSNDVFASISTAADLSNLTTDNTWGYTYSLDNGTTWSNYNGLPLHTADNPIRLKKNTGPAEDTINFKIAAKSSTTQPSGAYSNAINFTAITKPTPVTLADVYASEGKELYHGYYKMQDMTHTICEEVEDIGAQLQVIDIRDDKVYWISKLADNNCWMTQNLDLDLISDPQAENYVALTSENTDLTDAASPAYQDGYTINENGIITWLPEEDTVMGTNSNNTYVFANWGNDNNNPYSADVGNLIVDDSIQSHGLSGNYYNWTAAVASNNAESFSYNSSINATSNPKNSICPKAWKLPITLYLKTNPNESVIDFDKLNQLYNHGLTDKTEGLLNAPVYILRSGRVISGTLVGQKNSGVYWYSTSGSSSMAYYMYMANNIFHPSGNYGSFNKNTGMSIRCLAR